MAKKDDQPLISQQRVDFLERAVELRDPAHKVFREINFWARIWVQGSLPHSDPGNLPVWGRDNGRFSLTVQPGMAVVDGKPVSFGIPYGVIPRLILCWMCTEAVRTQNPLLFLGDSLKDFMNRIGLPRPRGGKRGNINPLKEQLRRLTRARISYSFRQTPTSPEAWETIQVSDKTVTWWSEDDAHQTSLFPSYINLDPKFFREIVTKPVPIKVEALRLLKKSPLALDLYTWLTFRVFHLRQAQPIAWKTLKKQIGSDYAEVDEFARHCRKYLRDIHLIYPELRYDCPKGRLILYPSPPHVSPRQRSLFS